MSENITEIVSARGGAGSPTSGFAKRHPLVVCFVMAYAITWAVAILLVASAQGVLSVQIPPSVHFLVAYGPILAAFIVTGINDGATGLRELAGRMLRWRVELARDTLGVAYPRRWGKRYDG